MSAFALMRGFDVERRGDLEPSIPEQPRPALILHWGSEEVRAIRRIRVSSVGPLRSELIEKQDLAVKTDSARLVRSVHGSADSVPLCRIGPVARAI